MLASASTMTDYEMRVEPCLKRIRVEFNGTFIADSTRAIVLHETRVPPTYYIPRDDVSREFLAKADHQTHCPFKGNASYWRSRSAMKQRTTPYGHTRRRRRMRPRSRAIYPFTQARSAPSTRAMTKFRSSKRISKARTPIRWCAGSCSKPGKPAPRELAQDLPRSEHRKARARGTNQARRWAAHPRGDLVL